MVEVEKRKEKRKGEDKMEKMELVEMIKGYVDGMGKVEKEEFVKDLFYELGIKERKESNRKKEVLEVLKESGKDGVSIMEIGNRLNMSSKNVSSILSYLRKEGVKIGTRSDGKKFIED